MNKKKIYDKEFFKHVTVGSLGFHEWKDSLTSEQKNFIDNYYELVFAEPEISIEENPFNLGKNV